MDSFEAKRKIRAWEVEQELEQLKAQMLNPQAPPQTHNTKYTPHTSDTNTKKKYFSQEIEEELEQLKAQMRNPQSQTNYNSAKYNSPANDKNKVFYQILEIKPAAPQSEIKQAYKSLVKKWHPIYFLITLSCNFKLKKKLRKSTKLIKNFPIRKSFQLYHYPSNTATPSAQQHR